MNTLSIETNPQSVDPTLSADLTPNIVTHKIEKIILDPKINTREIDSDIVVEYKEAMEGYGAKWQDHWNELPRITESRHLWSGFHTLTAAHLIFGKWILIRCVVEGENERDAYFLATRTNAQHGRRRTNAEKQTSVDRWLNDEEMNQWTDGYIAKMCQVSPNTVANRRSLEKFSSQPTKRKFINAKGDIEWMHTTRIGKTQAPLDPPVIKQQDETDKEAAEEEGPDLQGLKEAVYASLDEGAEGGIYAPALSDIHNVPLDQVESIIAQAKADFEMEAAEKHKESLMNDYDDLTAEGRELWSKHLKRFISWDGLYAAAQSNWLALEDSKGYRPKDESEESLKLQIGIWKNFKADLEYTVSVIHKEPAERGQIWLLKLLVIKPEREEQPTEPTWIQIIFHGQHHTGEIDRHVFRVDTPMADEYIVPIANAAIEAAKEAYTRLSTEKEEEQKPQLGFETVKYIKDPVIGG